MLSVPGTPIPLYRPGVRILLLRGVRLGSDPVLHCGSSKGRLWLEAVTWCSADNSLEAVGNSFPFFFFFFIFLVSLISLQSVKVVPFFGGKKPVSIPKSFHLSHKVKKK